MLNEARRRETAHAPVVPAGRPGTQAARAEQTDVGATGDPGGVCDGAEARGSGGSCRQGSEHSGRTSNEAPRGR